jgi:hypothetical protein
MRLVVLDRLSPYLSMHMQNIQIRGGPGHQFECKVVMDFELDSKSHSGILNWLGSPPYCAHLLGSPTRPWCLIHPPHHLYGS